MWQRPDEASETLLLSKHRTRPQALSDRLQKKPTGSAGGAGGAQTMLRDMDVSMTCCIGGALSRRAMVGLQGAGTHCAQGVVTLAVTETGEAEQSVDWTTLSSGSVAREMGRSDM